MAFERALFLIYDNRELEEVGTKKRGGVVIYDSKNRRIALIIDLPGQETYFSNDTNLVNILKGNYELVNKIMRSERAPEFLVLSWSLLEAKLFNTGLKISDFAPSTRDRLTSILKVIEHVKKQGRVPPDFFSKCELVGSLYREIKGYTSALKRNIESQKILTEKEKRYLKVLDEIKKKADRITSELFKYLYLRKEKEVGELFEKLVKIRDHLEEHIRKAKIPLAEIYSAISSIKSKIKEYLEIKEVKYDEETLNGFVEIVSRSVKDAMDFDIFGSLLNISLAAVNDKRLESIIWAKENLRVFYLPIICIDYRPIKKALEARKEERKDIIKEEVKKQLKKILSRKYIINVGNMTYEIPVRNILYLGILSLISFEEEEEVEVATKDESKIDELLDKSIVLYVFFKESDKIAIITKKPTLKLGEIRFGDLISEKILDIKLPIAFLLRADSLEYLDEELLKMINEFEKAYLKAINQGKIEEAKRLEEKYRPIINEKMRLRANLLDDIEKAFEEAFHDLGIPPPATVLIFGGLKEIPENILSENYEEAKKICLNNLGLTKLCSILEDVPKNSIVYLHLIGDTQIGKTVLRYSIGIKVNKDGNIWKYNVVK